MINRRGPALVLGAAVLAAGLLACGDDGDSNSDDGGGAEPAATAAAWPSLGRDLGHSRAATGETTVGPGNVADLAPAWELDGIMGVTGTPVVVDDIVYVGDWTGSARALDARTGDEIWATDLDAYYIGGSVALDDDRVFVGTFDTRVVALDAGTGEEIWRYWTVDEDESAIAGVSVWGTVSVDVDRGHIYLGTGNSYGPEPSPRSDAVIALDLATGEEIWVTQFTEGDVWTTANPEGVDADVGGSANFFTVDGVDALGVADKAGVYHVLARDDGELLWEAELTEGGLMGGVQASAAVADGTVFVASNRASTDADLIALDTETGDEHWRVDVGGHAAGPVSWANGVVYLADDSGQVAAYDAGDGTRLWRHKVPANAAGGVAVVDGTVYAGYGWWFTAPAADAKGGLIAFRLDDEGGGNSGDGDSEGGEAADGERIYQSRCATCHGGSGEGGTGPSFERVAERLSVDEHIAVVTDGRGDKMPAWSGTLSDEEIQAVVDYQREVLSAGP